MKKNVILGLICILACLFLVECASRKDMSQVKDDLLYVRLRLDALQSENKKMMELLRDVNKSLTDLQEESNRTKADLIAEMSSLRNQAQFLQGLLDDTGDRMSKLLHTVEDKSSSRTTPDSSRTTVLPENDSTQVAISDDTDPKALYDAAYMDLSRNDFDLALRGFREYLNVFPNSEYSDNAQYWIGEIYYARKEFERAFNEFNKVDSEYPQGDKMPAALLKMGYCLINLNDKAGARRYLDTVIQRYPNSAEAGLARSRLGEL